MATASSPPGRSTTRRTRARQRFLKSFPARIEAIAATLPPGTAVELWWQSLPRAQRRDEVRIGHKNGITRRWARRGTRPRAPHDQRTASAYLFGAICLAKGKGAGLVMPWCDTTAMAEHLQEISLAVDPGCHAVVLLDQVGRHGLAKLVVPDNITLLPLPPRSPELNSVENVWQFMRDNWLLNRVFTSYADILDHCCEAWRKLTDQPWRIISLGLRE